MATAQEGRTEGVYTSHDGFKFRETNRAHAQRRMRRDDPRRPRRHGYGQWVKMSLVAAEDPVRREFPHLCPLLEIVIPLCVTGGKMSCTTRTATLASRLNCSQRTVQRTLGAADREGYLRRRYARKAGEVHIGLTTKALPPPFILPKPARAREFARSNAASELLRQADAMVQAVAEAELFTSEKETRRARNQPWKRKTGRSASGATSTAHISLSSWVRGVAPEPFVRSEGQQAGRRAEARREAEAQARSVSAKAPRKAKGAKPAESTREGGKEEPANQAKEAPAQRAESAHEVEEPELAQPVPYDERRQRILEAFQQAADLNGPEKALEWNRTRLEQTGAIEEVYRLHPHLRPGFGGAYQSPHPTRPPPDPPPDIPELPERWRSMATRGEIEMGKRFIEERLQQGVTLGALWERLSDKRTQLAPLEAWHYWRRELTKSY